MVAVSPQSVKHNRKLIEGRSLNFEVLCDEDNAYASQLGLKHGFADDLKDIYGQFGINLDDFNGNSKWELAIPSRLVVAKDGTIVAVDTNADYTLRPEPTETIEVLKGIGA